MEYLQADVDEFQSTLPVWGATPYHHRQERGDKISIHAPRVGSDRDSFLNIDAMIIISIHAPRVGSDGVSQQD